MVEHEVAMAIHHLSKLHNCNNTNTQATEIECALSWLEDAQNKMDAARQPINSRRNRYNELSKSNRAKVDEYINGVASGRIENDSPNM
jgi:uncharacterized membrane protein